MGVGAGFRDAAGIFGFPDSGSADQGLGLRVLFHYRDEAGGGRIPRAGYLNL